MVHSAQPPPPATHSRRQPERSLSQETTAGCPEKDTPSTSNERSSSTPFLAFRPSLLYRFHHVSQPFQQVRAVRVSARRVRLTDSLSNPPQAVERLVATLDARGGLENLQVGGEASDAAVAQSGAVDPADVRLQVKENRRLSPAEVAELADAYRRGTSQAELSRRFGVHRETVRRHLMGQGVDRRPRRALTDVQEAEAVRLYVEETLTLAELG